MLSPPYLNSPSHARYRLGSFSEIDTNADGRISREEFAAACAKVFNVDLVPFVVDTVFAWVCIPSYCTRLIRS